MSAGTSNVFSAPLRCAQAAFLIAGFLLSACSVSAPRLSDRQIKAQAMFAERCKTAGETIHRTVENVDGLYLLKLRPEKPNFDDQFKLDDPFTGPDVFIDNLLMGRNAKGSTVANGEFSRGYAYVEAMDPNDGKRYRYTGRTEEPWHFNKAYLKGYTRLVLDRIAAGGPPPRYGVTYDDISTHEEREYWVAGSSLRVVDLQTNEVIAERVGYMFDLAQGSQASGRSPWLLAKFQACPSFPRGPGGRPYTMDQVRNFVEKVLHINQGSKQ